jgi:hypothetical protein
MARLADDAVSRAVCNPCASRSLGRDRRAFVVVIISISQDCFEKGRVSGTTLLLQWISLPRSKIEGGHRFDHAKVWPGRGIAELVITCISDTRVSAWR